MPVRLAGIEVARERATCVVRRLPRFSPNSQASLEAGNRAVDNGLIDAQSAGRTAMVTV